MRIVTAQLNYTIGDFAENTRKILEVMQERGTSCDLIVFSELCISGYYPKDLVQRSGFIEKQNAAIEKIKAESKNIQAALVIGCIQENPFAGKDYLNALEFIEQGETRYTYQKQLLPTYGVFDEARHFEPGQLPGTFLWKGKKLGFLICEDAWEDRDQPLYKRDPVAVLEKNNLDLVISINASPYNIYKRTTRHELVKNIAQRCAAPVIYVNQVGAIDELVFDGNSLAYSAEGECLLDGRLFEE